MLTTFHKGTVAYAFGDVLDMDVSLLCAQHRVSTLRELLTLIVKSFVGASDESVADISIKDGNIHIEVEWQERTGGG